MINSQWKNLFVSYVDSLPCVSFLFRGEGGGRSRNDVLPTCKASLRGIIKFFSLVVVRDVSISLNDINFRVTGNFGLGK